MLRAPDPQRSDKIRSLLAAWTVLVALGALTASAQQESDPLSIDQMLRERISVEVVNIDVVVAGRDGLPVSGLGREAFEVYVDGEKVELTNFYAVQDGTSRAVPAAPSTPSASGEPAGRSGTVTAPSDDDLHVVAYLDGDQTGPMGLKRAVKQIRGFLEEQITDGARVMLITKHVGQNSVHGFLDDRQQLHSALKEIEGLPIAGVRRGFERTFALEQIREHFETCAQDTALSGGGGLDPCEFCYGEMRLIADSYARSRLNSRRISTIALGRLVGGLATLPGRKALLYVSDGLELQPGIEVYSFLDQMCSSRSFGSSHHSSLSQQLPDLNAFNRVVALANANRVTFYGLEAAGLEGSMRGSIQNADPEYAPRADHELLVAANLESSLTMLSIDTGGRAILNSSELDRELVDVDRELSNYYSIGVALAHPAENESHRVRVEVPGHRGEVRYRKSFLHQEAEQDLAEKTLGSVLFGVESNPLEARIDPGSNAILEGGLTRVGFDVAVPIERLTLLEDGDIRRGRLTWLVVAPEAAGGRPVFRRKQVEVEVPKEAPQNGLYRLGIYIDLPPGGHLVGMGLKDDLGDVTSILGIEVSVPEPGAAAAGR